MPRPRFARGRSSGRSAALPPPTPAHSRPRSLSGLHSGGGKGAAEQGATKAKPSARPTPRDARPPLLTPRGVRPASRLSPPLPPRITGSRSRAPTPRPVGAPPPLRPPPRLLRPPPAASRRLAPNSRLAVTRSRAALRATRNDRRGQAPLSVGIEVEGGRQARAIPRGRRARPRSRRSEGTSRDGSRRWAGSCEVCPSPVRWSMPMPRSSAGYADCRVRMDGYRSIRGYQSVKIREGNADRRWKKTRGRERQATCGEVCMLLIIMICFISVFPLLAIANQKWFVGGSSADN